MNIIEACTDKNLFGQLFKDPTTWTHWFVILRAVFGLAMTAEERGIQVIIAGAGGAAHLPGMTAAHTALPVLGVPVESRALGGLDSLLSIVQMPAGVPVGTLAIGKAGAVNAALLAASILGLKHPEILKRLKAYRKAQTEAVLAHPDPREEA